MKIWRAVSAMIALTLAAVLLYFSLRGIEWSRVRDLAADADPKFLLAACAVITLSLFLRAMRWRVLLRAQAPVSVGEAFWATCGGYFGNSFLPARAGELVRTYMVHASSGLSSAYVLTTALSERVSDAITLVAISALAISALPPQSGWLAHATKPFVILGIGGMLAIALAPRCASAGFWLIDRLPPRIGGKVRQILEHVLTGIQAFHDPGRLMSFAALTVVIWSNDAAGAILMARAVHLTFSVPVAFLLLAGLGLGSALPSTPGYVGIYQFVAVSVLAPFGFTRTEAIGYILLLQALQYLVVGGWGAIGFSKFRRKKSAAVPVPVLTAGRS